MTANIPRSATLPEKLSVLPDAWVAKIFVRLSARYGTMFLDRWKGVDIDSVRAVWAEELGGFRDQPERIAYALKSLADSPFPPTLPEFLAACRSATAKDAPMALPHRQTPDEIERSKAFAGKLAEVVKPREYDGLLWAKRPKSQKAMDAIADAKKEHRKFPALAEIFDQHLAAGVCNESGKLLKRWDGQEWVVTR